MHSPPRGVTRQNYCGHFVVAGGVRASLYIPAVIQHVLPFGEGSSIFIRISRNINLFGECDCLRSSLTD